MKDADLNARLRVVERLTKLFRFERMVHLSVTTISLVVLIGSAVRLILRDEAGAAEFTLFFGSSGLIGYSASQLLRMWNQALRMIAMQDLEKTT